jgi:hypothetical protein
MNSSIATRKISRFRSWTISAEYRQAPDMRFGKKPVPTLPIPFERLLCIGALMFLASCNRFEAKVDPKVAPAEKSVLAHGNPEPVAASRDSDGVQSEFLESIVLVRPKSAADLQSFLARYDGTVDCGGAQTSSIQSPHQSGQSERGQNVCERFCGGIDGPTYVFVRRGHADICMCS